MILEKMLKKTFRLFGVFMFLLTVFANVAHAGQMEEQLIKMALVYKIAKFVEWPQERKSSGDFMICAVGNKQRVAVFKNLGNKKMAGMPISIRLSSGVDQSFDSCHILFIDALAESAFPFRKIAGKGVLTISDSEHFVEKNGMIGLNRQESKIRIHINLKNSKKERLVIHAPLLQLSTVIED